MRFAFSMVCLLAVMVSAAAPPAMLPPVAPPPAAARTFVNPVRRNAADPWIVFRGGFYYMTSTAGNRVDIRRARTLEGLGDAEAVTIWRGGGPGYEKFTRDIWAPELHWLNGKWYAYYTATDGPDANRRVFALQAVTDDPLGLYLFKGKVSVPNDDSYAIDGTIFQAKRGGLYFLWSGRQNAASGPQNIYIAPMSNPWTINGPRVRLSTPEFDWEKHGWAVNEGPEVLTHANKTFVTYSASGFTTPEYSLGLLTHDSGNLLDANTWRKSPKPVFTQHHGPDGNVYGPGHNGFFLSPDGAQNWIVYHGRETPAAGRDARAQPFGWAADGPPLFGHPIPVGVSVAVPSGETPQNAPTRVGR